MTDNLKRKAAMVLHQIEESLGNFVLNNGDVSSLNVDSLDVIHKRELDKGRVFNSAAIKDIIEATYLDELFRFALDITKDNSLNESVKYLYSLFHHLDIYEIRNVISHPNRPFWDCYWYRVAAIASDPVHEILKLDDIKKSLVSAEKGLISDPPEEWLRKIIWQIPNNIPKQFDHTVTGLIGRKKEIQELQKLISNPRINTIALVAPGGTGKTALALDLLSNIVSSPSYSKYIDAVFYVTMKTEKLTANGIVYLDSIETISELKKAIVDSVNDVYEEDYLTFDDIIDTYKNSSIFLCIDNLETLLRDNPNSFEDFNCSLPPSWRVLVTSRIVISNSSIFSMEMLKESAAIHLARIYMANRGGNPLDEQYYLKLVNDCFYNPLAIRLTIDLILTGKDVPESINIANKEIAEFSYNNLIDALSSNAIDVLEAIFVEDTSSRLSLCEILRIQLDDVSSAIGELSKTSLITRKSAGQGESYSLSNSVKELLLISPKNIDARNNVQNLINKRRELSNQIDIMQNQKEIPFWHQDFIPKDTSENLKILVKEINQGMAKVKKNKNKNTEITIPLYKRLQETRFMYEQYPIYHKASARVSEALRDYLRAEDSYKRAISLDKNDIAGRYLLARLYFETKRYNDSACVYENLISDNYALDDNKSADLGRMIISGYCLGLLYSGQHDKVLEFTKKWQDSKFYRGILGSYRASAWKRKIENTTDSNPEVVVKGLSSASKILDDVFRSEGYFKEACIQAKNIFKEVEYCFSREIFFKNHNDEGEYLLNFVAKHILEVEDVIKSIDSGFILKLKKVKVRNNPFNSYKWNNFEQGISIDEDLDEYSKNGFIIVKITGRPDRVDFLFAKNSSGETFFLHCANLKNGAWQDWVRLSIGELLSILPDWNGSKSSKSINAKEIYLIQ